MASQIYPVSAEQYRTAATILAELIRLASFQNFYPPWLRSTAPFLARNGWYYAGGQEGTLTCYHCGQTLDRKMLEENPLERHKRRSPNCPLFTEQHIKQTTEAQNLLISKVVEYVDLTLKRDSPKSGAYSRNVCEILKASYHRANGRGIFTSNAPFVPVIADRLNPDYQLLRVENTRLSTFHDWPADAKVSPAELASAGFFYTGHNDRVQCTFCRNFLKNWTIDDNPAEEHKKHFPDCRFVKGLVVGNVPLEGEDPRVKETVLDGAFGGLVLRDNDSDTFTNPPPPVITPAVRKQRLVVSDVKKPRHPEYADETKRVASFVDKTLPRGQNVNVLANAGYFYVGPNDNVRCFHCNGGLKNWGPVDDPWVEHAKWFPRCGFLRNRRDPGYIKVIQDSFRPTLALIQNYPDSLMERNTSSGGAGLVAAEAALRPVDATAIDRSLHLPATRVVLEMGYPLAIIKQAIENQLRTEGTDFADQNALAAAVASLAEKNKVEKLRPVGSSSGPLDKPSTSAGLANVGSTSAKKKKKLRNKENVPDSSAVKTGKRMEEEEEDEEEEDSDDVAGSAIQSTSLIGSLATSGDTSAGTAGKLDVIDARGAEAAVNTNDEEMRAAIEENQQLRESKTCKVCIDEEVNVVFLPCGHLACCNSCAPSLKNCPICRALIRGTVRVFLS